MNIPTHVGQEATLSMDGRTYTLSRWTRGVWKEFIEWAKQFIPNPREVCDAELAQIPREQGELRAAKVKDALGRAVNYLRIGSPEVNAVLESVDGMTYLAYLLLRKNHETEATEDLAYDLVTRNEVKDVMAAFAKCAGKDPPKDEPRGS